MFRKAFPEKTVFFGIYAQILCKLYYVNLRNKYSLSPWCSLKLQDVVLKSLSRSPYLHRSADHFPPPSGDVTYAFFALLVDLTNRFL